MKFAIAFLAVVLAAEGARAADPVYLDELIETPVSTLTQQFGQIKREGCYQIGPDRFLLVTLDKKEQKPWRVVVSAIDPCRKPVVISPIEVRERNGVSIGDSAPNVVARLGRPDAAAAPDPALKKLGDSEYFYICRVEEGCARHTSILIRNGVVTAISEWYSN